ncbi:hypothetical protein LFM09_01845 [Lentzea alba]|uniref:hypothetical protein n=1 Tax=Lentzea alba TaxID=2714351 RepID=UPI0039BF8882
MAPFRSNARLRLRPPVRRERALPRPARLVRSTSLLLLVALFVGGLGAAYQFYLDGVPGSPRLPKPTEDNQVGSAIGVVVPQGVELRQRISLGKVHEYHLDHRAPTFDEPDPVLGLDPSTIHLSFEFVEYEPVPFDLILALEGGARVPDLSAVRAFTWEKDGARITVDGPFQRPDKSDHVVLHVTPKPAFVHEDGTTSRWSMQIEVLLRPLWPFAVRDNARVVLRTPLFHGVVQCAELDPPDCRQPEPLEEEAMTVQLELDRSEWKTDLLHPAPGEADRADLTDSTTWWTAPKMLRVTGNYVNINAEAAGQRRLFLAGLLAGFALGLVPVVVEKIRAVR